MTASTAVAGGSMTRFPASRTLLATSAICRRTGLVTLNSLLARLHANKPELLMVLDLPEIPLHTNGSENDIRCRGQLA